MSSYFQMGHDTENLVGEQDLNEFKGIILSPVNRGPDDLQRHIQSFRAKGTFDIVLDPQLYFPNSQRENLRNQPYFPADLDTADLSSEQWWDHTNSEVATFAKTLGVNTVTSPIFLTGHCNDDYYALTVSISNRINDLLVGAGIQVFTTVMINFDNMVNSDEALRVASIISQAKASGYYLVIVTDKEPRRELSDATQLSNIMRLIQALNNTNKPTLVSYCSSDMMLFKVAGASHCASGKFFNLRRFTKSRWDEPAEGGGQLYYWFEHSLISFLRQADIFRLRTTKGFENLIGTLNSNNYWAQAILNQFRTDPQMAWLALSWKHYLSWFGKTELALSQGNAYELVREWLRTAEANWIRLEDNDILFDDPRNNGSWVRPWRQALSDFVRPI